jgi:hypothetical protein
MAIDLCVIPLAHHLKILRDRLRAGSRARPVTGAAAPLPARDRRLRSPAAGRKRDLLVPEGHAFKVTALEFLAGDFRGFLIEPGEARSVEQFVTSLHTFGERVGRSKNGASVALCFTKMLLCLRLRYRTPRFESATP